MITNTYGGQSGDMNFPNHQVEMYRKDIGKLANYLGTTGLFSHPDFTGYQVIYMNGLRELMEYLNTTTKDRDDEAKVLERLIEVFTIIRGSNIVEADDYIQMVKTGNPANIGAELVEDNLYKMLRHIDLLAESAYEVFVENLRSSFSTLTQEFESLSRIRELVMGADLTDEA